MHVSTGWRVRWVLRHCSQPPPRYQSRGYGSAAIAAPGPQRTYSCWCTRCIVAALALLLHCSQPPPRYLRLWGCCYSRTQAAAHTRQQLQPVSRSSSGTASATAAKPAPLLIEGPRGCCRSRGSGGCPRTAAPQPVSLPHQWYCSPPLPCYHQGAEGG